MRVPGRGTHAVFDRYSVFVRSIRISCLAMSGPSRLEEAADRAEERGPHHEAPERRDARRFGDAADRNLAQSSGQDAKA